MVGKTKINNIYDLFKFPIQILISDNVKDYSTIVTNKWNNGLKPQQEYL